MPKVTRRGFLVGCSTAIAAMAGSRLNNIVFGSPEGEPNQQMLVVIFLRGGCDALNLIPPIAGADRGHYELARPDIQVPVNEALSLNAQFGLHPAAAPLHDLYTDGKLAIVQATGLIGDNNEATRSHFDAMAYMELGTPFDKSSATGWLTRHLQTAPNLPEDIVMPALAIGSAQPTALLSNTEAIAMTSPSSFQFNTGYWRWRDAQRHALRKMYEADSTSLHQAGIQALNATDIIELNATDSYNPGNGAVYPNNTFGNQLRVIAQMIKLQLGLRVATIDLGGWDTHDAQGNGSGGYFANNLVGPLAQGLAAFYTDLDGCGSQTYTQRLSIVVMSEFGRRLRENADQGTDHGHGGMMMVLGDQVNGGLYGTWPGLNNNQLFEGADLATTTDYRQVLSEILNVRMENPNIDVVFPGYTGYTPLGIAQPITEVPVPCKLVETGAYLPIFRQSS